MLFNKRQTYENALSLGKEIHFPVLSLFSVGKKKELIRKRIAKVLLRIIIVKADIEVLHHKAIG